MTVFFLDCEASSLSWNSYPIEIAWGSCETEIQRYLISPASVVAWQDWSYRSQRIHGISKNQLLRQGVSPEAVCDAIEAALIGRSTYTDNPDWDAMWLGKLFCACARELPPIDIQNIDSLLIELLCPDPKGRLEGLKQVLRLKAKARGLVNQRHRAAADVEFLLTAYELAVQQSRDQNDP